MKRICDRDNVLSLEFGNDDHKDVLVCANRSVLWADFTPALNG